MAQQPKNEAKSDGKTGEKTAGKAKAPAKTAAAKPAAAAAASAAATEPAGPTCTAAKCKQPVRAKGYCRKHYIAWRRGKLGAHHRYKICTKEGCRKPRVLGSLCEEHSGKGAKAEGAAA
jgi:hypothetical protein